MTAEPMMRTPPIVGVPCFTRVRRWALGADLLAEVPRPQPLDELGPDHDGGDHREQARYQDGDHASAKFAISSAMPSSPTAREALTRTASPGSTGGTGGLDGVLGVGRPGDGVVRARRAPPRRRRRLPSSFASAPISRWNALDAVAELGHLAEDRDLPALACALGEMLERGAHGVRVRVVRVVDHEAAARKRELLAAPGRERDVRHARRPHARAAGRARRTRGAPRGC